MLQILSLEDRIADKDRETALSARSLVSLEDHLADLVAVVKQPKTPNPEGENLNPVTIADANGTPAVVEDNAPAVTTTSTDEAPSIKQINDAYRATLKTQGFKAASAYLDDLKANNKLPKNFTF